MSFLVRLTIPNLRLLVILVKVFASDALKKAIDFVKQKILEEYEREQDRIKLTEKPILN